MASMLFVIPGDIIDLEDALPQNSKKPLRIGPGIRVNQQELRATITGALMTDQRKNIVWVEQGAGCYVPAVGDLVIGTVSRVAGDLFVVSLSNYTLAAILPNLSFEGATKKTRPMLQPGAVVYARINDAQRFMDAELECVSSATGKADGLGPLTDGMLFNVSLGMARRLLMPKAIAEGKVVVLEELGAAGLAFETAVGRNGKVWVKSEKALTVIMVGRALAETDEKNLDIKAQKKLVRGILDGSA